MTPMVPFLPSELIDSIVDHLHDDKETLRICSLVSHRWLPSCLFHLFHHLTYLALRGEGSFTPLIDFLDNGKHLRPRIRSLTLDGLNTQELCGRGQKSHGLSHPQLYRILCLLPALRSLELRKVSFRNIIDWTEHERQQFQERDPPGFSIENLTLDSTGQVQHLRLSASPFELDGIFSIFTSIGNLRMHNMAFFPTEHHWPSGYQHSGSQVGPDSVYIDGCSALYLPFICLEKRPPPRSLTVRSRDILSIGKYLRNVGCYLKDLDLDLEMGLDGQLSAEWIEKSLGFSRCTSLSSFTMWIYDKRLSLGDRTWRYIETILARLPSGVREPTICIGAPHRGYATWLALSLQSNQWKAVQDNIDRLLGSRRLRLAVHASSTLTGMRFIPLSKQYDRATDLASRKYTLVSEVGRILVTINTSSPD